MLTDPQDGPGHGEPQALFLGKPAQTPAHGQPGLRLLALLASATPRCFGPGPAPNLVPQDKKAVPPSCDTALQIKSRPQCPLANLSPSPKYGMTHVRFLPRLCPASIPVNGTTFPQHPAKTLLNQARAITLATDSPAKVRTTTPGESLLP